MVESRQTTIRFGDMLYRRLEEASERTGLPINSIVIVACMEWLKREPDLERGREVVYHEGGRASKEKLRNEKMFLKERLRNEKMHLHDEMKMQRLSEHEEAILEKMRLGAELEELQKLQAERKRLGAELEQLSQLQAEKKRQFAEHNQARFVMKQKRREEEPEIEGVEAVEEPDSEEAE